MKRPTISVTGPAETQSAPWQFWPAPLGDLSGGEVAIGSLKDLGDCILQSNDFSEDGGGAALGDTLANATSDLTPNELAGGPSHTAFDATTGSAELAASDLSELQEGLSDYRASDIDLGTAASESGGAAAPTVASLPAVPSAAASDTFDSFAYAPTAPASIPVQLPPGVVFGGFDAAATHDAAAQAPVGIAVHNVDPGAAAMDGGGDLGPQAVLANPAVDSSTPVADAAVGPGGATAAQVQQALDESGLSVNGSGVRVGVLSDSFNDLGGAAADEADGALPSAANIDVIKDLAAGGTDEGRAMMQIIHDIAPGADLAFYTAFDSEQDFADGILALAAAGCKVIVDDVSYFDEPFFQNGVVAQAVQTVVAEGVTYVTAAGNEASNGYQSAWVPISGTYDGTALTDAESFGGSLVQTITINTEGTGSDVPLLLEWNQAYGQATSDLEILVFNSSGRLVGEATDASSGEPTNPWVEYDFTQSGTYYVAIENLSGPNPGLIKEITEGDGLPATISGANSGTVFGHAMTPGAISTGAVSAADTPAFGSSSPVAESFSSSGAGTELLFANNGTALSSPDVFSPVAVSGVDDIATTVPGGLSDFYGTSAASASLAGVAALILSANPDLTPAQVEQIVEETALPMPDSAVSGAGLVQVDAAVAAALPGPHVAVANITLSTASIAASSLFTASDPNGYTITAYDFEDAGGSGHFVLNGVPEPDNQATDVTAAQLSQLTYQSALGTVDTLEIRAEDQTGWGSWASFVVTAPALVIKTDTGSYGSTSLAELGNNYFLYASGTTTGPELNDGGTPVQAGGAWAPIGAVETTSGYEVAWQLTGTNEFTIWNTDSDGNFISDTIGSVSGTSVALEQAETTFNQDLNGDGVFGLYAAPGTTIQISQPLGGTSGAATIGSQATLELAAGDSASITFATSTGLLKLDQPSTFSGEIFGFTGNGTLSSSDQIDLKGINFSTVQDSYTNGVLTVTDGTGTVQLDFSGSYSLANFKFASDGSGGTIVYDPPVPGSADSGTNTAVVADNSADTFVFHSNLGQLGAHQSSQAEAIHIDHAEFAPPAPANAVAAHESMAFADAGHADAGHADAAHDVISHSSALAHIHHAWLLA
jgi:hypothetical protein